MNLALPGIVAFLAPLVVAGFMIRWKGFYRHRRHHRSSH